MFLLPVFVLFQNQNLVFYFMFKNLLTKLPHLRKAYSSSYVVESVYYIN